VILDILHCGMDLPLMPGMVLRVSSHTSNKFP
jgi:hypothetical protein